MKSSSQKKLTRKFEAALAVPSRLSGEQVRAVSAVLNAVLADAFALYLKTKNFHWHLSGPHFNEYHKLLDEQGGEIIGITDAVAERVRKIGGTTIRSIGHIARLQRISDNDAAFVDAGGMLAELRDDNLDFVKRMAAAHDVCADAGDVASTSLLENWIDHAEKRAWFLFEITRPSHSSN
ncbi:MAG TPA: DNA starvation/stationary phase protection protein [Candidatus Didemnitutus sp.]|jgi:starvation-inducible DNA-binding protein